MHILYHLIYMYIVVEQKLAVFCANKLCLNLYNAFSLSCFEVARGSLDGVQSNFQF